MILSSVSPVIRADPEQVFSFFAEMQSNYLRWHPDHVCFRWLGKQQLATGSRFYFEERINGKLLRKSVVFTAIDRPARLEFAPTSRLFRFFLPRITFLIARVEGGIVVTQEIVLRIGPLAAWLHRRELDAVRAHMREEGERLKRLLEAA
ncbi:MAG: SRPBCC family protein [Rhizobiales bacterium]|nr:SRPBCC family protein [Hyphomicrobiales bacterium]